MYRKTKRKGSEGKKETNKNNERRKEYNGERYIQTQVDEKGEGCSDEMKSKAWRK